MGSFVSSPPLGATPYSLTARPGQSASGTAVVPDMMNVYNQLLGLNQQNYNNILSGYQQGQQNLSSQLGGIQAGYGQVEKNVMGTLGLTGGGWGVAAPAAQQIERQYQASQGQNQQALISAGLGNSTLLSNVMNQGNLQAAQAYGGLGAQLAQTAAGYQSQIGLAGLGARMQGLGMQNSLTQGYLGNLAGFHFQNTAGNLTGQFSASAYGGGGGHGGGGGGGPGPGGAAGAVAAAGGMPFGTAGQGNAYGYQGAYAQPNNYNPFANSQGGYGGANPSLWDLADQSQGQINNMGTDIWNYADLGA